MAKSKAQLDREISAVVDGTDRSANSTIVEYAVQNLFKGQSPAKAAKTTAKKHSGSENMFFGAGVTLIDPAKLEDALWDRLVDFNLKGLASFKADKAHWTLDSTLQHFRQAASQRPELKQRVIARLGRNPFEGLE